MQISKNRIEVKDGVVTKVHKTKSKDFKGGFKRYLHNLGFNQPVEFRSNSERAKYEAQSLISWAKHGFNAPGLISLDNCTIKMTFVKGRSLSEMSTEIIDVMPLVFGEMYLRHSKAVFLKEPLLIHLDVNLSNIFLSADKIFHIDFEMGRPYESINVQCFREISKFISSLGKAGISRDYVARSLCENYLDSDKLEKFSKWIINRSKTGKKNYLISVVKILQNL